MPELKVGISALILTHQEETVIARALKSITWCNEIVVVDCGSTDQTLKIIQDPQAPWATKIRLFHQDWLGFSEQRNFALKQAQYAWSFFLDADEECSLALSQTIKSIVSTTAPARTHDGLAQYKIHRQEFFLHQEIKYSIWNPSYHIRLFPTQQAHFTGTIHEGVECKLPIKTLHESIVHTPITFGKFFKKMLRYTQLQAENDIERGYHTNILKIALAFPAMFLKNLIYYKGYRDGYLGWVISILEGLSRTVRHLHIYQLQKNLQKKSMLSLAWLLPTLLLPSLLLQACAIHKPCSEAGDITWNPPIVGDKMCKQKKDPKGEYINHGPFKQIYQSTGKIALEGQFTEGRKSGIWVYYGEDEKLKAVKYFDKGVEKTPPAEIQKKIDLIINQKNSVIIK